VQVPRKQLTTCSKLPFQQIDPSGTRTTFHAYETGGELTFAVGEVTKYAREVRNLEFSMSRITASRVLKSVGVVFGLMALSACVSREKYPGYNTVASDLTPDMLTQHNRPIDAANAFAITTNENWRMFWADLGRASLLDRPSLLSRPPVPH